MNSNTRYNIALIVDAEPVIVAVSYYPKTRVERVDVDVADGACSAVTALRAAGVDAVLADTDTTNWARTIWKDRKSRDYAEL